MVRPFAFLVGLFFAGMMLYSFGHSVVDYIASPPPEDVVHEIHQEPRAIAFKSDGPFGKFDEAQLQRGMQVYKEVCSACHSLRLVAIRSVADFGYNEAEVKAFAAGFEVPSVNPETGEASTRKATPADHFPSPYLNETAARAANNNALPPDLSLITKSREGGARYVASLLTGYRDPQTYKTPEGMAVPVANRPPSKTLYFNPWFANLNIAMPPPLTSDGQVTYADGTKATVQQMATDVAAFLTWTAEPTLQTRKSTGWFVVIFLLMATVLAYMAYRNVWADEKH